MRVLLAGLLLMPAILLSGCADSGDGVKEIQIHVGWNDDLKTQYMTPTTITVNQGDKVRFIVTNDDLKNKDYNGAASGNDNFHDVALDYPGACNKNPIEHETPAGITTRTNCNGRDYFYANTTGTFRIICEVRTNPSHDALGMHARFIVK